MDISVAMTKIDKERVNIKISASLNKKKINYYIMEEAFYIFSASYQPQNQLALS